MTVRTADYWVDCCFFYFGSCCPTPCAFIPPFLESATYPAFTNVLSSGLPLPAPGLSGSLFVSGLRGLGSGCPAERRLGEVVVWISLQPLSWIGCFLRLGRCGLLQSAVILHGSNCGICILHGKKKKNISYINVWFYIMRIWSRWMCRQVNIWVRKMFLRLSLAYSAIKPVRVYHVFVMIH